MKKDPETDAGPVTPPKTMPISHHARHHDFPSGIPKVIFRAMAGTVSFLALGSFSALAYTSSGTTFTSNGSASDTQAAVNAAPNGSTVIIPNGNYTWSSQVNVSNYIILTAATAGSVTITHGGGSQYLVAITESSAGNTQLAGINFLPGSANNTQSYVQVIGSAQIVVMHDCTFNVPNFQLFNAINWFITGGLIYNCHFFSTDDGGGGGPGSGSGCLVVKGNLPWLNASTFGNLDDGTHNLYIENCTFDNIYNQAVDGDDNTRVVVRYCTINNTQMLTHGTTSLEGGRQVELYKNAYNYVPQPPNSQGITWVNVNRWFWWRAGTARVWGNTVDALTSQEWGAKPSWCFIDESLTRPGSGSGCQTEANYPGVHWPGNGANGTSQISDPVYIWGNSAGPHSDGSTSWGTTDQSGYGCSGGSTGAVFLLNRDIFLSAPPSYAAYAYPHPLRSGGGGGGAAPSPTPLAPQDLRLQ